MLDTTLYLLNLENGTEKAALPGLISMSAPRRAARGRENDTLIVLLAFNGNAPLRDESLSNWLTKKAEEYFKTSGTVTFAIKTFVDNLNGDLMERNLRRAQTGAALSASLSLAVLRRESLYLVNFGSAHAYFANALESADFSDGDYSGRGLGVNQMLTCRFAQREIKPEDVLVMSCQPPSVWNDATLAGCTALSTEAVSRRLTSQVGPDLKAVLVRFAAGKGLVTQAVLNTRPVVAAGTVKAPTQEPSPVIPIAPVEAEETKPVVEPAMPAPVVAAPVATDITPEDPAPVVEPVFQRREAQSRPAFSIAARIENGYSKKETLPPTNPDQPTQVQKTAGKITQSMVSGVEKTNSWFTDLLQKMLPGMADEPLKMSRSALIAIALAVPLLIAIVAGTVYARVGKSRQFDQNLILAQEYAIQAEVQVNDPPLRLASLQQALFWLDKAETYGESETSASLRVKVQGELDVLEGIQRLEMVEVTAGGLPSGTNITQMVATATDLYLLDGDTGKVLRYFMGSAGYEKDEAFDCGPNPDNLLNTLGNLVDMVPINVNNSFKATLLAVDAAGNTAFCIPGEAAVTGSLTLPDQGWKNLTSISMFNNYLYVLDSGGRAVYRYEGDGILFEDKPTLFFDNQIPDVTKAIDIEVNGDELYILRSNGQMVECTYSHLKDYKLTECIDPALYGDMRTGQQPEPISFPEADFIQMRMTAAPDSSIYLLDTTAKALYHFSLQRNLQKILHPRFLDGVNLDRLSPTAVAVSSGRMVFMAFGSLVYYAPLP